MSINNKNHDESLVDLLLILYTVENTLITRDKQKAKNKSGVIPLARFLHETQEVIYTTGISVEPTLHHTS